MKFTKFEQFNEALVSGKSPQERSIDLRGPEGNAYAILGMAQNLCKQLKDVDPERYNWEEINKEMTSGDYKNLVNTFEEYFGEFVTIYNADVLDESLVNEFKNPFRKKPQEKQKWGELISINVDTGEPNTGDEDIINEPSKEPIIPEEGYDLERFYNTISKLHDKGQKTRKKQIANTFFRDFIGKELMGSTIKDFDIDVLEDISFPYYGININLENGGVIGYGFTKNDENPIDNINVKPFVDTTAIRKDIEEDTSIPYNEKSFKIRELTKLAKEDAKKLSRKDARLIGQIARKFNPNTKYKNGTGDLIIKEYESKTNVLSFNDFIK